MKPEGLELGKKNRCIINIEPLDDAGNEREDYARRQMLDYFIEGQNPTWADQFKLACHLGPQINEED